MRGLHLNVICLTAVAAALVFISCGPQASEAPRKPNILFVFADDHAYQAVSAYGSKINKTPNIDRLAKEGIRFDRCLVTNSICAPARAVILSGRYSHLNGVVDNRLAFNGSQQTFPKLLQGAGYQTAIVGKWHLKSDPTGFDYWEVLPGQGDYYNPDFRTAAGPALPGPYHRHHHRPHARLAQREARSRKTLHADVPAQSAAPQLDAGARISFDVRRRDFARTRDAV